MEAIEQTVSGSTALGGRNTATISRNGDLLGRMSGNTLLVTITMAPINLNGHTVLQEVDKQYGHWMEVHAQLTEPNEGAMIGSLGDNNFHGWCRRC